MPSLVTYERKRLTEAQYHALGVYITRKKPREGANQNGTASSEIDKQTSPSYNDFAQDVISNSPVKPTAREIHEQKQQELNGIQAQLAELESMLSNLKEKKHEFFEELKGLVHSKKHEERERQLQGFPSPFIHHPGISPGAAMMNVSPFRPGMKRPRSPSPPLVQLYSPLPTSSNIQPAFSPMGINRMPGPPENMNPGYQFQQNYPPRDTHLQPIQGPRVNPPPNPPRPTGNPFPPHDRTFPPFGTSQVPGHQNPPRPPPPPATQPPFTQQKKRESHGPPSRSRYH